jgi:putative phosphoribosyl transferase
MLTETVTLRVGAAEALNGVEEIQGDLRVPAQAIGVVVFAHGSGSSRFSARNRSVAAALEERALGTLLLDLLTREEAAIDALTAEFRFDIPRLGGRVVQACDWLGARVDLAALPIGCFGASTGAAAALVAAAERPDQVRAVVSRGGRPDLAGSALLTVRAPTLLIVGGADREVIELNRRAQTRMAASLTQARVELVIVPHATHLFEEPGALTQVSTLAGDWFTTHLHARA